MRAGLYLSNHGLRFVLSFRVWCLKSVKCFVFFAHLHLCPFDSLEERQGPASGVFLLFPETFSSSALNIPENKKTPYPYPHLHFLA